MMLWTTSILLLIHPLLGVVTSLPGADEVRQTAIHGESSLASTIRDVLAANEVIGDVLDDFEPSYYIDINYPKFHEPVLLGNDIPVKAVQKRPIFTFHSIAPSFVVDGDPGKVFTLVLTDPDAKSRANPKWSEMCHWIVTNLTTPLPGDTGAVAHLAGELEEYLPPGPPKKTGPHRYVFVLLEGDSSNLKPPTERRHWGYDKVRHGVRDWAEDNGLTVVGANFFFAEHAK